MAPSASAVEAQLDGRQWRPMQPRIGAQYPLSYYTSAQLQVGGAPIRYEATLEPNNRPWLLVLAVMLRPETVWSHLRRNWWRGVIGGLIANTGYGIAIYALVLGPMAHVAALRETSVLFGALMGTLLLGEPFGLRRIAAAFVIVSGLVLMNGPALF